MVIPIPLEKFSFISMFCQNNIEFKLYIGNNNLQNNISKNKKFRLYKWLSMTLNALFNISCSIEF